MKGLLKDLKVRSGCNVNIFEFLKGLGIAASPEEDATFILARFVQTQVDLLLSLAQRSMELGCQPLEDEDPTGMAIICQGQALAIAKKGTLMEIVALTNLGMMLYYRWERLDDISDICEAIECARQVMTLCSRNDLQRATTSALLGGLLQVRFARLGHLADVDQAVEYRTLAVRLTPEGDSDMPERLCSLALSLCRRYERIGSEEDLNRALEHMVLGAQLTPGGHRNKPDRLVIWGTLLEHRHKRYDNLVDIYQAIECFTLASQAQSKDDPRRLTCLMSLGGSFCCRYDRTGDLSDLNNAVECLTMVLWLSPPDYADRPRVLGRLGAALARRSERLGSPQDLQRAVQYQESATELASDSDMPDQLSNLGTSLRLRYRMFGDLADVNRAIEYQSRAIQLASEGRKNRADLVYNLGDSLRCRYGRLVDATDLDLAIEHLSSAVRLTPDGHSHSPRLLGDLGILLSDRFEASHNQADINLAVHYLVRAAALTPDGHPGKPSQLLRLGMAYSARFQSTCAKADLVSVVTCCRKAANPPAVNPEAQVQCAQLWIDSSLALNRSPFEGYQAVFALLPHFVWLGQTVQARYNSIPSISNLVSAAVAWAISVGSHDLALEWLEQGRSVVWAQQLQTRTPFDDIAAVNPQIADRMRDIASQLEAAEKESEATNLKAESSFDLDFQGKRHGAALHWEQLLQEVRQLPGFQDYMLPRKEHILKKAATRGAVVVINTHKTRCDALIIVPDRDDVMHVPLARLVPETLPRLRADMKSCIGCRGDKDKPRGFKRYRFAESAQNQLYPLEVLWLDVVEPILNALQYIRQPPQDELPYITWCATGELSFLPLHAAGLYDGTSRNTFDHVISSYTPTLAALLASNYSVNIPCAGVLAVGQMSTPGLPQLPKTVDELAIVEKYTAITGCFQLDGARATVDATLEAMARCGWVHLACHAIQNRSDPAQSAFHLHDGSLTLETITRRKFKHKGLAFLSACQTATGDDFLPDEAMHLAAGMLAAGYPSVIATMWSISDEDGPEIAEVVYRDLVKDGKLERRNAAIALHNAAKNLREKVGMKAIARWAPFIHIGL
ncbi:hypothetical protein FRC09_005762 [Ceratobasidium sp. 395]|nr:hypothetical protein FRC09_005762 [Ceratobasidium sp. 395]